MVYIVPSPFIIFILVLALLRFGRRNFTSRSRDVLTAHLFPEITREDGLPILYITCNHYVFTVMLFLFFVFFFSLKKLIFLVSWKGYNLEKVGNILYKGRSDN